jgi:ribose/xylose/arabinose/galactoside ABC-type transport system permease subunit
MNAETTLTDDSSGSNQTRFRSIALSQGGGRVVLVVFLIVELIFFALKVPGFFEVRNLLSAGRYTAVFLVVGVGTTFGLISGAIDISIAGVVALSGSIGTQVMVAGASPFLAIGVCLFIGAFVGLLNGIIVVKFRVNPLVATLGMLGIARGTAFLIEGGGGGVVGEMFRTFDPIFIVLQKRIFGIPSPVVFSLVVIGLGYVLLSHTRLGQYAYAVGGNPEAARAAALPVDRLRILFLMLSGVCAGMGGWMMASMLGGTAATIAVGWELTIITAIIFGGVSLAGGIGSMVGTFLGTTILGLMVNGMNLAGWPTYHQLIAQGSLLLFAVGIDSLRSGGYR